MGKSEKKSAAQMLREAEAEWRAAVRLRCEWQNIVRGNRRACTIAEIVCEGPQFLDSETFGPAMPRRIDSRQ